MRFVCSLGSAPALSYLWQHRVRNRALFPGAAMFEAAYATGAALLGAHGHYYQYPTLMVSDHGSLSREMEPVCWPCTWRVDKVQGALSACMVCAGRPSPRCWQSSISPSCHSLTWLRCARAIIDGLVVTCPYLALLRHGCPVRCQKCLRNLEPTSIDLTTPAA